MFFVRFIDLKASDELRATFFLDFIYCTGIHFWHLCGFMFQNQFYLNISQPLLMIFICVPLWTICGSFLFWWAVLDCASFKKETKLKYFLSIIVNRWEYCGLNQHLWIKRMGFYRHFQTCAATLNLYTHYPAKLYVKMVKLVGPGISGTLPCWLPWTKSVECTIESMCE